MLTPRRPSFEGHLLRAHRKTYIPKTLSQGPMVNGPHRKTWTNMCCQGVAGKKQGDSGHPALRMLEIKKVYSVPDEHGAYRPVKLKLPPRSPISAFRRIGLDWIARATGPVGPRRQEQGFQSARRHYLNGPWRATRTPFLLAMPWDMGWSSGD